MQLSKRLLAICELVPDGSRIADIGCDHGLLGIYLIKAGKASSVIACDINTKPLQTAERNIRRYGCEGISLRLGDGLSSITPSEIDTCIIAGMGGELIAEIIDKAAFLRSSEYTLVLQPMSRAYDLRKYLAEHGFEILKETAVRDKRLYTVLQVRFSGKEHTPDSVFCAFGRLTPDTDAAADYISRVKKNAADCMRDLENSDGKEEKIRILKEIIEHQWH